MALIEQLHGQGGTIVVITHEHAVAERCPRQIQMLDGRIVSDSGTHLTVDSEGSTVE
jgi:predicted ABC-type transport system involved in lysophospholipase L1 biosynthesis ATPase subunit